MFNLFSQKPTIQTTKVWVTPACQVYTIYETLARSGHCLIAGATGSGKSTVMEGMLYTTIAVNSPARAQFILIDLKKVALRHLKNLPHVVSYADTIVTAEEALRMAARRMDARFDQMQRQGVREWQGADLYIVVDECGDLLTSGRKKALTELIQRIGMLGRAAKVHLWLGSQVCTRDIISSAIKANVSTRIALRTATSQESRNICGVSGAEQFPSPIQAGKALGLIRNGADIKTWNMPRYTDEQISFLLDWWTDARKSTIAA